MSEERWRMVAQPPEDPSESEFVYIEDNEGQLVCDATNSVNYTSKDTRNLQLIELVPELIKVVEGIASFDTSQWCVNRECRGCHIKNGDKGCPISLAFSLHDKIEKINKEFKKNLKEEKKDE